MSNITLDGKEEGLLSRLQDTDLSPMEEALFQAWTKANQIDDPDNPEDRIDYRGIYKQTGGVVSPHGELSRYAEKLNKGKKLEDILQKKMEDRLMEVVGSKEQKEQDQFKAERQDITHKQKLELEQLKMKKLPHEAKMKEHDVRAKQVDVENNRIGLDAKRLENEGKKLEITGQLVAPKQTGGDSAPKTGRASSE